MKFLAIDQSLTCIEWVYITNEFVINKGTIKSSEKGIKRLIDIKNQIMNIIAKYKDIDAIIMEDYSYGSRGRATFSLGELGGVLKTSIIEKNLESLPPAVRSMDLTDSLDTRAFFAISSIIISSINK